MLCLFGRVGLGFCDCFCIWFVVLYFVTLVYFGLCLLFWCCLLLHLCIVFSEFSLLQVLRFVGFLGLDVGGLVDFV